MKQKGAKGKQGIVLPNAEQRAVQKALDDVLSPSITRVIATNLHPVTLPES